MNNFRITFTFRVNDVLYTETADIGLIQDISTVISPKSKSSGMPSQPSQNSFVFDYGVTRTYSFTYRRISSEDPTDQLEHGISEKWSNGFWVYVMKHYIVNRWQAETDGCKISFTSPDSSGFPDIPLTNVYVSSFTASQTAGDIRTLTGTIRFTVGGSSQIKEVAEHTVIYDANFGTFSDNTEALADTSNMVNVTDNSYVNANEVPATWLELAQTYGIYDSSSSLAEMKGYFRWNDKADGTGNSYKNLETVTDLNETYTLYAQYNKTDPGD